MKKLTCCPVCGYNGIDVVFKFFCSNPICQNFKEDVKEEVLYKEDEKKPPYWPIYDDDDK